MLPHLFLRHVLTCTFLLSVIGSTFGQASFKNDLFQLKKLLAEYHVQPRPVDDGLSKDIVQGLFEMVDPDRLYYTQAEVSVILSHQKKVLDDINLNTWTFVPVFEEITRKALMRARASIVAMENQSLQLDREESFGRDSLWASDEAALQKILALTLKVGTLTNLNFSNDPKLQDEHKCKRAAQASMLRAIDKLLQHHSGFGDLVGNLFLNAYLRAHDPHSAYFSPAEMQNFVASLSSQGFHFGFVLEENLKGNVFIKSLIPGSPAWKSGEIHRGDLIDGMAWQGKPAIDATLLSIDEIEAVLMESNDDILELSLRSAGGNVKNVKLKKELQSLDEDVVRSSVLVTTSKIGYISLPDFYSNWDQEGSTQAANDVAKAIIKLKKEDIKGLILDLRFNGGGSLQEAVAMAGIFVDAGPIGLLSAKDANAVTYKDFNRGTVWDGPLVILVNGLSASASEFLAAALQDYNRALIVGTGTYGKGTAQNIFSLEAGKPTPDFANLGSDTHSGYATITTERCYRISGKSVQYVGVVPDILIPELEDFKEYKESGLSFALKADDISKKVYFQPLSPLMVTTLSKNSQERINSNPYFSEVQRMSALLDEDSKKTESITITKESFSKYFQSFNAGVDTLEKMAATDTGIFNVQFLSSDVSRMSVDEYFRELNTSWSTMLRCDHTLGETVNIITDFIERSKTP